MRRGAIEPITPLNEIRISPEPNSGCWLWVGTIVGKGYGQYWRKNEKRHDYAHRVVWESHHGPIKNGLEIDHLCRTPSCVNPSHLEPVTRSVNSRRGLSPGLASKRLIERNKSITHCPKGHEYTVENTYIRWNISGQSGWPSRYCRTCNRIRKAELRLKSGAKRCF